MIDKGLVELLDGLFDPDSGWAVAGGHAADVYRLESRFTEDLFLLVSLGSRSMRDAASGLTKRDWTVRVMMSDGWLLRVSHPEFGYMYVIASETRYQDEAPRRSRAVDLGEGLSARVLSVEDVIVHKLIANRAKDDADIEDILRAGPSLDWRYLDDWFDAWDLRERFENIVARMRNDDARHHRPLRNPSPCRTREP